MRALNIRKIISTAIVINLTVLATASCGNSAVSPTVETAAGMEAVSAVETEDTVENTDEIAEEATVWETAAGDKEDSGTTSESEGLSAMDIVKNMRIGWNIGNTLDSTRDNITRVDAPYKFETAWGNPKVTQELIDTILDNGFNVIRIPVSWKNHIAPAPDYTITDTWMERVKEVVDYAYNKGAYVIVNTHHEDWNYPYYDNLEPASEEMRAVWSQIAETFKDYDEHLIFEGQNEPRKVGTNVEWTGGDQEGWDVVNELNQVFVDTVRSSGGQNSSRLLMICGYGANSTVGIKHIDIPENDNRIIISVHAYEPYDFALNTEGRSEWNNDTLAIDTLMSNLKSLYIDKGIPVIIGEFGAMNKDNEDERVEWATYYVTKAKEIGVPCIWWDNGCFTTNGENFGLFDRSLYVCRYPKLLEALMEASKTE
jgi:endoglucanase